MLIGNLFGHIKTVDRADTYASGIDTIFTELGNYKCHVPETSRIFDAANNTQRARFMPDALMNWMPGTNVYESSGREVYANVFQEEAINPIVQESR